MTPWNGHPWGSSHRLKRTSAAPAGFALQHCAWSWLQQTKGKKTQLTKRCPNRAIANQVLPRIDLSSFPNQGWSCNVYPFLSVAVATSADRPGPSSGTLYSLKKVSGLSLSLQENAKAIFNWFWESSCSALSNKAYSDQDFYFSATLLMHNKVWSRS